MIKYNINLIKLLVLKKGFNLLKIQAEPPSVWTKIYNWVLGTARVVIVTIEVMVLIAFVIRIVVDLRGKELDAQIERGEAVLDVLKASEEQFRIIQAKTAAYKQIWTNTPDYSDLIENINSLLPVNTSISELTIYIDKEIITISGVAAKRKEEDVRLLESNLKDNSPYLTNSTLEKLQDSQDLLTFQFRATLKNINNKTLPGATDNGAI